ncbi:MAG: VCBS repeat-containing protein [Candidatus Hydrogenedentota bacterium]
MKIIYLSINYLRLAHPSFPTHFRSALDLKSRDLFGLLLLTCFQGGLAFAQSFPEFKHHDINPDAGTGLAITVADVDSDGDTDIVGVSSDDVAWYENPSWERHLIADTIKNSNVCIAGNDVDGDGTIEFALGADWQFANTNTGGALYLLRAQGDVKQPWQVIELVSQEPTLHRIRWADTDGDGKKELVVAPLKGIGTKEPNFQERGVRLYSLRPGTDPFKTPWREDIIDDSLHVLHNVWPISTGANGKDAVLAASFEGITRFNYHAGQWSKTLLAAGNPAPLPNSGAGEIKSSASTPMMLATIEPWHGNQAVVYAQRGPGQNDWERHVVDDSLAGGHAVWWSDFDGDNADELMAGWREKSPASGKPGLAIYDFAEKPDGSPNGARWVKHIVDDGGMATEDALAADINGDGKPDIVAFGRATHNIKYYENLGTGETKK